MLIKILGVFDILSSILLFVLSFSVAIPKAIILFFVVILLLKGAFILTKSIASAFDIFAAIILILTIYFAIPRPLFFIAGILLLQKGFLSVVA